MSSYEGGYVDNIPPTLGCGFFHSISIIVNHLFITKSNTIDSQLIMAAFQQVSEPLPTLSPSFLILLHSHLNNENPQQVRLENRLDL